MRARVVSYVLGAYNLFMESVAVPTFEEVHLIGNV